MNSKSTELSVGLFVLVGIAAIFYLAVQIGGSPFTGDDAFIVKARFNNIGGLNEGTNVMVAGVKVGKVGRIVLDPEQNVAIVELKLDKNKHGLNLNDDAVASIKTSGLIGDKYIGLNPGYSGIPLEAGETIVDTESALDIEGLISKFAFGSVAEKKE